MKTFTILATLAATATLAQAEPTVRYYGSLAQALTIEAEPRPMPRPDWSCDQLIAMGDKFMNPIMGEAGLPPYPVDDMPSSEQSIVYEDALSDADPRAQMAFDLYDAATARACVFPGDGEGE